jgi:hypothetical protein
MRNLPRMKILAWLSTIFIVLVLVLPLALYQYTVSLLEKMPEKSNVKLSDIQSDEVWMSQEKCSVEECASITPYWIYKWLAVALVNDLITFKDSEAPYDNVSNMCSKIAIQHLRQSHFKAKGMLWWHLTHANLSIWLQRNWSANEISSKYISSNSY